MGGKNGDALDIKVDGNGRSGGGTWAGWRRWRMETGLPGTSLSLIDLGFQSVCFVFLF